MLCHLDLHMGQLVDAENPHSTHIMGVSRWQLEFWGRCWGSLQWTAFLEDNQSVPHPPKKRDLVGLKPLDGYFSLITFPLSLGTLISSLARSLMPALSSSLPPLNCPGKVLIWVLRWWSLLSFFLSFFSLFFICLYVIHNNVIQHIDDTDCKSPWSHFVHVACELHLITEWGLLQKRYIIEFPV